jgi:hypothetical protein
MYEISSLCHSQGLFEDVVCLWPLLHGLREPALGREKALLDVREHKGKRRGCDLVHEPERFFIGPRLH